MNSSSDERPASGATAALIFLIALPLSMLVGAVFISSLRLKDSRESADTVQVGSKEATEAKEPANMPIARDPPPSLVAQESAILEQSAPADGNAETPPPALPAVATRPAKGPPLAATSGEKSEADEEAATKSASRGIVVEELSKETYNVLTELHAVLESKAWDDAAKLIAALDPTAGRGIAPYFDDRALLTSLPVAIQIAREDYPQLRQVLTEKMTTLAKLRIVQAMNSGDAATVQFAAVQFAGTPAATEAHRWLGDRALMQGHFAHAIAEYERAGGEASPLNGEIGPRIRLAAAMMGRGAGEPVKESVQFGEVTMPPAEFEALVAAMKRRSLSSPDIEPAQTPLAVPPPSGFEAHVLSRLDGPVGERPQDDLGRRINQLRVPWADRQIATVVEDDTLYVANRFQIAAYKLPSGERVWQSQPPAGQMQRAQEWGLIPMRPLIVGERIYVRLLYSPSPLLVCLEKSSGKLLWVGESRENEFLVSDPMLVQGRLVGLSVLIHPDQHGLLRYNVFDRRSGEIVHVHDVLKLRSTWGARACCEVSQFEDGIAVVLGGVILAVDGSATIRWVRKQNMASSEDDRRWVEHMFQRPIVRNGRLYVTQPGVRSVECVAVETGRQYWSVSLPEVVGIIGMTDDLLVVRSTNGVCGIDLVAGTVRWRVDAGELYSFHLVDGKRLLLAGREQVSDTSDRRQPRLTWIDPADGKRLATTTISTLADSDPRLGPLVSNKNRLFTFFGRGQTDATRDVIELIPRGNAESVP